MKKVLLVACLIFGATNTHAALDTGSNYITKIHTYYTHTGILYKTDSMVANGCTSGGWYILPKTHAYYEENKKMLLNARILNRTVGIMLEGCLENYPIIRHVTF